VGLTGRLPVRPAHGRCRRWPGLAAAAAGLVGQWRAVALAGLGLGGFVPLAAAVLAWRWSTTPIRPPEPRREVSGGW
jgi:hypothetical protein